MSRAAASRRARSAGSSAALQSPENARESASSAFSAATAGSISPAPSSSSAARIRSIASSFRPRRRRVTPMRRGQQSGVPLAPAARWAALASASSSTAASCLPA